MSILTQVLQSIMDSAPMIVDHASHDWQIVKLSDLDREVEAGGRVYAVRVPDPVRAWGREFGKATLALAWGTALAYGSTAPNKRAYLCQAVRSASGEIQAVPLALFVLGPQGWFLSSRNAPPRFGDNTAIPIVRGAAPLDVATMNIVLSFLEGATNVEYAPEVETTPIEL